MGLSSIIIDTSVIIAYLNKKEKYHNWAVENFKEFLPPLITCEPVITECSFLLKKIDKGNYQLFELIKEKILQVKFNLQEEFKSIDFLLQQYSDIPISLADACLIRMSEIYQDSRIITLDSDFKIYKKNRNKIIDLIIP